MKSALINRYFELSSARKWTLLIDNSGFENAELGLKMMRIDFILFNRYGYDISLTRKN